MNNHLAKSSNAEIAVAFREAASLLRAQGASPFRVSAYEKASDTIANLRQDVTSLAAEGVEALENLPNVGSGLALAILEMARTGRWAYLERLRGTAEPEALFQLIPGIGPALARRIHGHLDCDTLEALEIATREGRLAAVPGVGPRRAAAILLGLSGVLNRRHSTMPPLSAGDHRPSITMLLDVDREYREKAQAGCLQLIAPKRFNPDGKSWLPILHTERGPWHFTVLYSNTARAHDSHNTGDWVVIYYSIDKQPEGQCTVVTETSGALRGQRVVRGREREGPRLRGPD